MKRKVTTDALEIMDQEFYHGQPRRIAGLQKMRAADAVEQKTCDASRKAGLSLQQSAMESL